MPGTPGRGLVDCEIPWSAQSYLVLRPGTPEARENGCTCVAEQPFERRAWLVSFGCPTHVLVMV